MMKKAYFTIGGYRLEFDSLEGSIAMDIHHFSKNYAGCVAEYEYRKMIVPDSGVKYDFEYKGKLRALQEDVAKSITASVNGLSLEDTLPAVSLIMRKVMHSTMPFIPELTMLEEMELIEWLNDHKDAYEESGAIPATSLEWWTQAQGENHEDTV